MLYVGLFLVAAIALIAGMSAIDEASKQREGANSGTAMIVGFFFTPLAGFLYCLCFPEKKKNVKEENK